MSRNYTLNYRTYDQLLADCKSDFKKYHLKDIIDPQDFIKVARRINYDLGLRIHQTKEKVLEVEKGRVRLPNDFYLLNFGLFLRSYRVKQYLPQGTRIEERIIGKVAPEYQQAPPETINLCENIVPGDSCDSCDPCGDCYDPCAVCPQCGEEMTNGWCNACCADPESCKLSCTGDVFQLVQSLTSETRWYNEIYPLRITSQTEDLNDFCPGLYWDSEFTAVIRKEGDTRWLYTSFQAGKVYINYEGHLEDKEGNLLVPDHPILNEYYEYGIKQRILENLIMNDEEVNSKKIDLIEARYRAARNYALSVVNTPNFQELKELFKANRNAMYAKYYDMFAKVPRLKIR